MKLPNPYEVTEKRYPTDSPLLMLVCAFAGKELIERAYQKAIKEGYRFYSFGDGMVIL